MKRNFKVGKYLGIDIYLHYSWFLIFALLAWALSTGFFPQQFPGHTNIAYWAMGLFSSLLLFVSVLLHELAHSVIAKRNGIKVDKITLFFFGGMAGMHEQKMTPKTEFQMAIAGPMFSLFLSMVFLVIYNVTAFFYVAAVASYLYRINLILAIFNMVPGFPLDGGRVLRSIVWYWTKDFTKATKIAATSGKFVAYFLIFSGFLNIFTGNFGGLWMVMIGFFLLTLSTLSYQQLVIKDALAGRKAGEFLTKKFHVISPDISLRQAVLKHLLGKDISTCIVAKDDYFLGMLSIGHAQAIPKKEWARAKVHDVMTPARRIGSVKKVAGAYTALIRILKSNQDFIPVLEKKKIIGIIRREDLLRYVKLKTAQQRLEKAGFEVK